MTRRRILVTDADQRSALACTRSLGGRLDVHVADSGSQSLAGASRFCVAHHRVPDAMTDPEGYFEAIAGLVRAHEIDVVIPATDAASRAILPRRDALAPARVAGAEFAAYEHLSHKARLLELARPFGIEGPRGVLVGDADAARAAAEEIGGAVVLKPVESVGADDAGVSGKRSVVHVDHPSEMAAAWRENVGAGQALVQERVPGRGEGLFVLRWRGETRAVFAHRRLREFPPSGGVSVLREGIAPDPALLEAIEGVLDAAGFDGVAMAEFRTDGDRRWLMEFNARFWGSLQLAIDSGVDFPGIYVDALLEEPSVPAPVYAPGVRSRWMLGELDHAIALARGRGEARGLAGVLAALRVLFAPAGPGSRWEVLRPADPRPFLIEAWSWLRDLAR